MESSVGNISLNEELEQYDKQYTKYNPYIKKIMTALNEWKTLVWMPYQMTYTFCMFSFHLLHMYDCCKMFYVFYSSTKHKYPVL